jgi:hypothetical protein
VKKNVQAAEIVKVAVVTSGELCPPHFPSDCDSKGGVEGRYCELLLRESKKMMTENCDKIS